MYMTDHQIALLEALARGNEYARWTARNEKQFLLQGVSVFPLVVIKNLVRRGYAAIEAGKGLNEGFDFLVITEAGKTALETIVA